MDGFHHLQQQHQQQDRRLIGRTMGGDQWYPASSSPPPPPPPGGYQHHPPGPPHLRPQLNTYLHHPPPPQPPPPPPPMVMPPPSSLPPHPPVPPYSHHQQPMPYPPPYHHQYPPPPPHPHHSISLPHPPPPPPFAYPPLAQAWRNPSWEQHQSQGWEYPERNISYSNEEDWAARAKAWAAATPVTETRHAQSHFTAMGKMNEHSYTYHDQYSKAVVAPSDIQQPSLLQSSNQELPIKMINPQKQVNQLHGYGSFSSGSFSYGTDGHTSYNVGDEAMIKDAERMASPQKSYVSSSSIYEQEVPYSYSHASGNRAAADPLEVSHLPLTVPLSSVQEGHRPQSTLPVQKISVEQAHLSHHTQSTNFLADISDQPLDFEPRHTLDHESHQKISYGHAGPSGAVGVMDHDASVASVHAWTQAAPGSGFPQIPIVPAGAQFDPSFALQASLTVPTAPIFGRTGAPSFQPSMPPVSASFGLGPGTSIHHAAAVIADANGSFNPPERPKKATVPNWLREEIIKKKSVIPGAQPSVNSFHSAVSEDADKPFRRVDQADSKSVDSARSTEDEEDDEEDLEAARSAAINQEIKRVLTEVLLKVTDELFDEIATKVLNENEPTVEVEESVGNQKVSPPPPALSPKANAKIVAPVRKANNKVDDAGQISISSSPGGDILGLGTYASDSSNDDDDDDDDKEIPSCTLPSSGRKVSAIDRQESNDNSSEIALKTVDKRTSLVSNEVGGFSHYLKNEGNGEDVDGATQRHRARHSEENHAMKYGSPDVDNVSYPEKASGRVSDACEEPISDIGGEITGLPLNDASALQTKSSAAGKEERRKESTSGRANNEKTREYQNMYSKRNAGTDENPRKGDKNKDFSSEVKASVDKARGQTPDASDSVILKARNKLREKVDKRDKMKDRADDRSAEHGASGKETDANRSSKHKSIRDDRKETTKDKREKDKDNGQKRREKVRDEKEDPLRHATKDSFRYDSRRSPSPSSRGKYSKCTSFHHGSDSGDEPSDNSKKRKQQSYSSSLTPSPTKSKKRQVSRSPHSKHSHRKHSPYSSLERRRSRSRSPIHRRKSAHKYKT